MQMQESPHRRIFKFALCLGFFIGCFVKEAMIAASNGETVLAVASGFLAGAFIYWAHKAYKSY